MLFHLIQEEAIEILLEKEVNLANFKITDVADQIEEGQRKGGIKEGE